MKGDTTSSSDASPSFWTRLGDTRVRDLVRFRLREHVDWRTFVAAANLPPDVTQLIECVTQRSWLWKREKIDVARELVAHFRDGLESGQTSQELVQSFGDPHQAAKLVRRAKRRGRPIWWHAWHWGWISVVVVCLLYLLAGLYQLRGRPAVAVDYLAKLNERALSSADESRAWPLYREALKQLTVNAEFPKWIWNPALGPQNKHWSEVEQWLADHQEALALVRKASKRPDYGLAVSMLPGAYAVEDRQVLFTPDELESGAATSRVSGVQDDTLLYMFAGVYMPPINKLVDLTHLLMIDAQRAALADDADTAMADVETVLRITDHMQQVPLTTIYHTADALHHTLYDIVEDLILRQPKLWSDDDMRDLAHMLSAVSVDWQRGVDGDRLQFLDFAQRYYTDNGRGDGRLAFRGPGGLNVFDAYEGRYDYPEIREGEVSDWLAVLMLPGANLLNPSRKKFIEQHDEQYRNVVQEITTPLWKIEPEPEVDGVTLFYDVMDPFMVVGGLSPSFWRWRIDVATTQGEREGTLIGIALELYRREHQAWPKLLSELAPKWLPSVPVDRITGKPLKYLVIDGRPRVYSVGNDGVDDRAGTALDVTLFPWAQTATPVLQGNGYNGDWVVWGGDKPPVEDEETYVFGE